MAEAGGRRRLVSLRVLELAVRRDHPLPPEEWREVKRAARRGEQAPEPLRAAVRADAEAILRSSDLGIAPMWLVWGFAGLAVLTLLSWLSTDRPALQGYLVVLYAALAGTSWWRRKVAQARAETALILNADPP
ncbi:MAG TPA: hypothetical protein VE547_01545 [Mycobacteriales bacterium]|jgi:hypothetical protein|nr:hypothetical protein [Mycobacteriales bacterium]